MRGRVLYNGPMTLGAFIYFFLLALWSAVIAYLLLFKVFMRVPERSATHVAAPGAPVHQVHTPSSTAHTTPRTTFSAHEGFRSMKTGDELTVDDIVTCLSSGKDC